MLEILTKLRMRTGKTIVDLAEESKMNPDYIIALEEGRRRLNYNSAKNLAPLLNISADNLYQLANKSISNQDLNTIIKYIHRDGSFNGSTMDEDLVPSFVILINDIWYSIKQSMSNNFKYSRDLLTQDEMARLFFKNSIITSLCKRNMINMYEFPFTFQTSISINICWLELYEENEASDNQPTVILEHLYGTSITNAENDYIEAIKNSILIPRFGMYIADKYRFLERRYLYTQKPKLFNIFSPSDSFFDKSKVSFSRQGIGYRVYRRFVDARKLPDPFANETKGDRCDKDSKC